MADHERADVRQHSVWRRPCIGLCLPVMVTTRFGREVEPKEGFHRFGLGEIERGWIELLIHGDVNRFVRRVLSLPLHLARVSLQGDAKPSLQLASLERGELQRRIA